MPIKSEKEIRKLDNQALANYANEFIKEHNITSPVLLALAKRVVNQPTMAGQLRTLLVAEHRKGNIWERDSQSSDAPDDDSRPEKGNDLASDLESRLVRVDPSALDLKIMNETAITTLWEATINTILSLAESDPVAIKNIVKALVNSRGLGSTSLNAFDKLLDIVQIGSEEFRPHLHGLAAIYRNKEQHTVLSKGLFALVSTKAKDREKFHKDIKKIIDKAVEATKEVLKAHDINSEKKLKNRTEDQLWRFVNKKSALAESISLMTSGGTFELKFQGRVYFAVDSDQQGSGPVLQSLEVAVDKIVTLYNAENLYQIARGASEQRCRKIYAKALIDFLDFSVKTQDPTQQLICWHFYSPALMPFILEFFEEAYDKNDQEFLKLLNAVADKYNKFENPKSPFFDETIVDIPGTCTNIETGSPLHFCIELSNEDEFMTAALRMAKNGKYLNTLSRKNERFQNSSEKKPSEFARSMGLNELADKFAKQERKFGTKPVAAKFTLSTSTSTSMIKIMESKTESLEKDSGRLCQ